ncbi:hypothetical protein V6M85_04875 [Sulfolobus tengchongensis]|uniref:Uncharacterized protein n=1 Tax=Sulfolobus tengchongensis TaxID=207809 RepID=A0AAX4L5B0_9CREN
MTPIFLEYKVIHDNISYYIIYVFLYNSSLKLVTMYIVNPNSHIILNYNVSLEPQQIFSDTTGIPTYYNLNGNKILAYSNNNNSLIVAFNGLILKKADNQSVICLVSANYPGISNNSFPNLYTLAKISVFDSNPKILLVGAILSIAFSVIMGITVVRYDNTRQK